VTGFEPATAGATVEKRDFDDVGCFPPLTVFRPVFHLAIRPSRFEAAGFVRNVSRIFQVLGDRQLVATKLTGDDNGRKKRQVGIKVAASAALVLLSFYVRPIGSFLTRYRVSSTRINTPA
jgi:hypothetical protein